MSIKEELILLRLNKGMTNTFVRYKILQQMKFNQI